MKPILFNTDMVKAILDGRKTQTRRLVKNIPLNEPYFEVVDGTPYACDGDIEWHPAVEFCPIQKGDVLYVRETWNRYVDGNTGETMYIYRTYCRNRKILEDVGGYKIKWRPSIHMPRVAARIFLRVESVEAERLQSISHEDVLQEGIEECEGREHGEDCACAEIRFSELWNSTIKPADLPRYGWEANPWVWVIEFERIAKP